MKTYTLRWSIVANFTGQHPRLSDWHPCDTTLVDVIREWKESTGEDAEPTEPYDSDYSYLAKDGSIPERALDRLEESSGETRFQICNKLKEQYPREAFWACVSDIQVSGILDRKTLFGFLDSIGASFEDCGTTGTLGGPLSPWGGVVPDFPFNVESQALLSCIRVTPILCKFVDGEWEPCRAPSEWEWDAIKAILKHSEVYDIMKGRAHADPDERAEHIGNKLATIGSEP